MKQHTYHELKYVTTPISWIKIRNNTHIMN